MNQRPIVQFDEDLPAVVLAPLEMSGRAAAWLIDVAGGCILAANVKGAAVLGLSAGAAAPLLDGAMPALAHLRTLAKEKTQSVSAEPLLFWTRNGALRLLCRVQISKSGARTLAIVIAEPEPVEKRTVAPSSAPELFAGDDAAKLKEIARRIREGQMDAGHERRRGARHDTAAKRPDGHHKQGAPQSATATSPALRASLAHELKTPLSAIAAAAEIMKAQRFGPLGTARYVGYATDIHGSAQHILGVIDRMLSEGDAAPEMLQGKLDFTQIDAGDVLKATVSQLAPLAEHAGIAMSLDIPPRLPHLIVDATSLRQIVLNLLTNALKFTPRGGRVEVTADYRGDGPLAISITDTGSGMSEHDIARLRTRDRPHRPKQRAEAGGPAGLGLGLPLVQTLAAANGADLVIESTPGHGTSASVIFSKDHVIPV